VTRIVRSTYRYKPPPPKRKPAAPLEGPRVVTIRDKKRVTEEKVFADAEPKPSADATQAESKSDARAGAEN
jgi:hypothetical protein